MTRILILIVCVFFFSSAVVGRVAGRKASVSIGLLAREAGERATEFEI